MSSIDKDQPSSGEQAGETRLRGRTLDGAERNEAADHLDYEQRRKTDNVVRADDEKDTLYDDGLELDEDSDPLTGINGADDTQRER